MAELTERFPNNPIGSIQNQISEQRRDIERHVHRQVSELREHIPLIKSDLNYSLQGIAVSHSAALAANELARRISAATQERLNADALFRLGSPPALTSADVKLAYSRLRPLSRSSLQYEIDRTRGRIPRARVRKAAEELLGAVERSEFVPFVYNAEQTTIAVISTGRKILNSFSHEVDQSIGTFPVTGVNNTSVEVLRNHIALNQHLADLKNSKSYESHYFQGRQDRKAELQRIRRLGDFNSRVSAGRQFLNNYTPTTPQGQTAKGFGLRSFASSREFHQQGDIESANLASEIGIAFAEVAAGFIPGVGFARDVYESITGHDIVTGAKLTDGQRALAVVGVITGGTASNIRRVRKVYDKIGKVAGRIAHASAGMLRNAKNNKWAKIFNQQKKTPLLVLERNEMDKIFRATKDVPSHWNKGTTSGKGGVLYRDPRNSRNTVRVMPGKPSSPYPTSRKPYVRQERDGQPLDRNGRPSSDKNETHIPIDEYRFL